MSIASSTRSVSFGMIVFQPTIRRENTSIANAAYTVPAQVDTYVLCAAALARGVVVSYEMIRAWCQKFRQTYANGLRRRRPRPGDKWHLDEMFIKINGKTHYLGRAVDQDGNVLDILVTSRRDAKAATRFFRRLLTGSRSVPQVLITDKLASYGVVHRRLIRSVKHRRSAEK